MILIMFIYFAQYIVKEYCGIILDIFMIEKKLGKER